MEWVIALIFVAPLMVGGLIANYQYLKNEREEQEYLNRIKD